MGKERVPCRETLGNGSLLLQGTNGDAARDVRLDFHRQMYTFWDKKHFGQKENYSDGILQTHEKTSELEQNTENVC